MPARQVRRHVLGVPLHADVEPPVARLDALDHPVELGVAVDRVVRDRVRLVRPGVDVLPAGQQQLRERADRWCRICSMRQLPDKMAAVRATGP